jgi:agmatinase
MPILGRGAGAGSVCMETSSLDPGANGTLFCDKLRAGRAANVGSRFPRGAVRGILGHVSTTDFDPDAPAEGNGIYGLPHSIEEAATILIPVPWEATVSYQGGTAGGPEAILKASRQVDLFDLDTGRPYEDGIAMLPPSEEILRWNQEGRAQALGGRAAEVDRLGELLNAEVYETARRHWERGRLVGVVGGEHSSPFGFMRLVSERAPGCGILQLDAHADLRRAYEGFRYSHASVFYNVFHDLPGIARIVQVGVRDLASREEELIRSAEGRIVTFFEGDLRRLQHEGQPWGRLALEIVEALPAEVYLSFDIDGLDPSLCPHTGTPVPGGLSFAEIVSLLRALVASGRRILGFDLCEVAPDPRGASEWDGNVGARLLYKMIGFARMSGTTPLDSAKGA